MKKSFFLPSLFIASSLLLLAFHQGVTINNSYHKSPNQSNGPAGGKTGAPGEQNCTSCHSGSALDGATENNFVLLDANNMPVLSYVAGATYTVNLALTSNPAKKGFQSTVLTSSNVMAGTFTAALTTQIVNATISGAQRNYAEHKATSNSSATPLWSWTWTAPATNVGNVTFYIAANKTNNNNNTNGDQIYLSQHVITAPSSGVGLTEVENISAFNLFYAADTQLATITFESLQQGSIDLKLVDMNGKAWSIKQNEQVIIGKNKITADLSGSYPKGTYILQAIINGKPFTKNIIIN
jgi:hypothetical protein